MSRAQSVRRVRRQKRGRMDGFIVTWDADSRDASTCSKLRRFVFGYETKKNGRAYRYPGFVERDCVRYLGQSVIFTDAHSLSELESFLSRHGIDHEVIGASLRPIPPS